MLSTEMLFSHPDLTPEPPTPAMLESIAAANSSLTEPASSALGGEERLTRGQGSVSGNLAALGRIEGSAQAGNPSITDAAAKLLSGAPIHREDLTRKPDTHTPESQVLVMQAGQVSSTMQLRQGIL